MINDGLEATDLEKSCTKIVDDSLELISSSGCAEYYDPKTGEACGGDSSLEPLWWYWKFYKISKMHIVLIIAHPNDADIYFRGSIVTWQSTEAIAFVKVLDTNLIHLNFSDGELS